jgi:F-type H+-transporting ATPase subunit gamma
MTERLADITAQIANVRQLGSVVTAMRGIAASRVQQSRSLLASIEAYSAVVSQAIGHALALLPANGAAPGSSRPLRRGLVLFCAEQGFAGAFSERVLDAAHDVEQTMIFLIGMRGAALATERGLAIAWSTAMVANVAAIPALANRIADAIYEPVASGAVEAIDLVCPRAVPGQGIAIDRHSLLPLDLRRFDATELAIPPLTTLRPDLLLERLAEEYVYAQLCEAATHAFAAENEARMLAMTAARTNIDIRLGVLTSRERQLRQEEITAEIIELAAGTAASGSWRE